MSSRPTVVEGDHWYRKSTSALTPYFERYYYYYDTPDGQDLAKKLFYVNSITAKMGLGFGAMWTCGEMNVPKSRMEFVARVLHLAKPFVVIPTLSVVAIHYITRYRQKDDSVNYFLGCFLGGQYLGIWNGKPYQAFGLSVVFGTWAMLTKYAHDRGYPGIFSPHNVGMFSVQSLRSLKSGDLTGWPEPARSWYTAEEVREKNLKLPEGKPGFIKGD